MRSSSITRGLWREENMSTICSNMHFYIKPTYNHVTFIPDVQLHSTKILFRGQTSDWWPCSPFLELPMYRHTFSTFLCLRYDECCESDFWATTQNVLWCCWLGGRKGIRPVKNWVVGCWCGYVSGSRCRFAYGPADATAIQYLFLQ